MWFDVCGPQIKKVRLAYFKTFWNILDIVVILIAICCVIFSLYRTSAVSNKLDSLLSTPEAYPDFNNLAFYQITFNSAIAIMVFICWVKVSVQKQTVGSLTHRYIQFRKGRFPLPEFTARVHGPS